MDAFPSAPHPMRVVHVVFSLDAGGMENGIVNLVNGLEPAGFESHVFCIDRPGAFASRLTRPERVCTYGRRSGFSTGAVLALGRQLRRLRPHLIHSHNLGPLIYSAFASGLGRLAPIVQGEHSELTPSELGRRRLLQRRLLFRVCSRVHTVSAESGRQLERLGLRRRVEAIPNGVDTNRFRPGRTGELRARLGIAPHAQVIGLVGRFGEHKRHDLLIAALEQLRSANCHLLLVGAGGPEEARIRSRVEASPARARIHLLGFSPAPESVYGEMDLLAVPSLNEGLSNVILEAMSCAVPVLSHDACGTREVLVDGLDGFIKPMASAADLAQAIESLLAEPERLRAIAQSAREKVVRSFSLESMMRGYAQLYRSLEQSTDPR
jgi:glycosyltransferase involved in cell wall biosynthesis